MASRFEEALWERFRSILPPQSEGGEFESVSTAAVGMNAFTQAAAPGGSGAAVSPGDILAGVLPQPSPQPPAVTADSSGGIGSTILSAAATVFENGLGLAPLVRGLLGLFGGGDSPQPPALVRYAMPEQLYFSGAFTGGGFEQADYDQFGVPRVYDGAAGARTASTPGLTTGPNGASNGTGGAPQIQVNVQAMDARSFLDHSSEIAQAVRQAMLTLNSLNDVVNEI